MTTAARIDATHDPALRSWVESAQVAGADFPIQNLPYGRFRPAGSDDADSTDEWRIGVAIGDQVLDLRRARAAVAWPADIDRLLEPLAAGDLNALMSRPPAERRALRAALSAALSIGSPHHTVLADALLPQAAVEMALPCRIGDYTDFYTGIHHATAVGKLFRPDAPLMPNYKWVPIGYHGRASSVVVSGHEVKRPQGQTQGEIGGTPAFGPAKRLDYELELAIWVGPGNALGVPISIDTAEDHLFGLGLLNDWSARDLQAWEYQPLGPFLAKSFVTTVSPWIVTAEALAPFRSPFSRPAGHPQPLAYLDSAANRALAAVDVRMEVWLQTAKMQTDGAAPVLLSSSGAVESAYWTWAQLLTHHTVNGCNLQPGDLLGTGTLSGPEPRQAGSLLELSAGGKQKVTLANGEQRSFLEDGDTVVLRACCERPGAVRIGFGEARGTVVG